MAAEDAVVDSILRLTSTVLVEGTKLGFTVAGYGFKAIGVTYYALAQAIARKRERGEKLTGGEVTFEKMMKSGEDIHAVWIKKDDLKNVSTIAQQLGISFFAVQNGDELQKSKGFLSRLGKEADEVITFSDNYSDMVSISYRASDEVRMAHILEMFDTFDPSQITVDDPTEKSENGVVNDVVEADIDEVEEFMAANGVEVEIPPEVVEYKEVNQNELTQTTNEPASEKNLQPLNEKANKTAQSTGNKLCFEQFGFDQMPTKAEFDAAYIKYITENNINPNEPNIINAFYEQGCKLISGEVKGQVLITSPEIESIVSQAAKAKDAVLPECYQFFGFDKTPTVKELKQAFQKMGEVDSKTANEMYNAALKLMEKSPSVRETLQAKQELHTLREAGSEKAAEKALAAGKNLEQNIRG